MKDRVIILGVLAFLIIIGLISGASSTPNTDQPRANVGSAVINTEPEEQSTSTAETEVASPAEPESAPVIEAPERDSELSTPRSNCDPNYEPCVPDTSYDLDCSDISFSVTVVGSDPHRFDRDGDGYGCESN